MCLEGQKVEAMPAKKMVIVATHGGEDPERAIIPFVMANAALATEMDVTVVLQTRGVWLAVKDYANHVKTEAFPPLDQLMKDFREMGGKMLACVPCLKARNITEDMVTEGTKLVAAGTVVAEVSTADATLSY
jgi:uncharacterized protein involved in oxidation of intracellular sulfur